MTQKEIQEQLLAAEKLLPAAQERVNKLRGQLTTAEIELHTIQARVEVYREILGQS